MTEAVVPVARKRSHRKDASVRVSPAGIRMVNGRLISLTLNDPAVIKEVHESMAELRKNPEALRAYYVKQGVITPTGRLTKRYGG